MFLGDHFLRSPEDVMPHINAEGLRLVALIVAIDEIEAGRGCVQRVREGYSGAGSKTP
jgi:hypothetical protein